MVVGTSKVAFCCGIEYSRENGETSDGTLPRSMDAIIVGSIAPYSMPSARAGHACLSCLHMARDCLRDVMQNRAHSRYRPRNPPNPPYLSALISLPSNLGRGLAMEAGQSQKVPHRRRACHLLLSHTSINSPPWFVFRWSVPSY